MVDKTTNIEDILDVIEENKPEDLVLAEFVQEGRHEASNSRIRKHLSKAAKFLFYNMLPLGTLPYSYQSKLEKRLRVGSSDGSTEFKPKVASIASAAYLSAIGYWLFNLPTQTFQYTYDIQNCYGLGCDFQVYYFQIPAILLQLAGAYLALDVIRMPISYFKRPCGTLLIEGPNYLFNKFKSLISHFGAMKDEAVSIGHDKFDVYKNVSEIITDKKEIDALNALESQAYACRKSGDAKKAEELEKAIKAQRKKIGLG